jgi:hypothetical protein
LEEVFWGGDKKVEGVLKDMITGRTHMMEPKFVDAFPVDNHLHLMLISNHDWIVSANKDERRYFVLKAGNDHKQDHAYFAAIDYQMENGGAEAMLYDLLEFDYSGVNLRKPPMTEALRDQRLLTLNHEQSWLAEILMNNELNEFDLKTGQFTRRVSKAWLYESYKQYMNTYRNAFVQTLAVLSKFYIMKVAIKTTDAYYEFPPQAEAIGRFEEAFGIALSKYDSDSEE